MLYHYELKGYELAASEVLDASLQSYLLENIVEPQNIAETENAKVLGGRGTVQRLKIPGHGSFVVKTYRRGGFLRYLPWAVYFGLGRYRSQSEFEVLMQLREIGVKVPKPFAWLGRGRFLKKAWLVLEEIPNERNLADLSLDIEDDAQRYCRLAAAEVRKLIIAGVWHVDLHPGNVLINHNAEVYLIDFDKAVHFKGSRNKLRDLYICRWRRAVLKYCLPDYLVELFVAEVRQDYEANRQI